MSFRLIWGVTFLNQDLAISTAKDNHLRYREGQCKKTSHLLQETQAYTVLAGANVGGRTSQVPPEPSSLS